jgi:hypothetical protein
MSVIYKYFLVHLAKNVPLNKEKYASKSPHLGGGNTKCYMSKASSVTWVYFKS